MTPFLSEGGKTYKGRVYGEDGRSKIKSLGTRDSELAVQIEARLAEWREDDRWEILHPILKGLLEAGEAYRLDRRGGLSAKLKEIQGQMAQAEGADLAPLVADWSKAWGYEGDALRQVRAFLPEGERFPVGGFGRKRIAEFLSGLDVSDSTRNRYRSALMSFANWLVEREVLDTNPVAAVKRYSEPHGREIWYERPDAEHLILGLLPAHLPLEALMYGSGASWQDCARLRVKDVSLDENRIRFKGSKTPWRNRTVAIHEAFALEHFRDAVTNKLPQALVFDGLTVFGVLKAHQRACKARQLEVSTLHDWRHTFAVLQLRKGALPTVVSHQLGHRNPNLVWTRYGRHVPPDVDLNPVLVPATNLATTLKEHAK